MRILFFLCPVFLLFSIIAEAQTDSTVLSKKDRKEAKRDSLKKVKEGPYIFKDSARLALEAMPKKAAWRSAIIPGLGQIYNKRWWKVPIIYGGIVSLGLAYEFNQRYYKEFLGEVQYRQAHNGQALNPDYAGYSYEGMILVKDAYRRNRDLSIIGFAALHAINIIDAYVDAKFFRFDVSNDLSFRFEPSLQRPGPTLASQAFFFKIKLAL